MAARIHFCFNLRARFSVSDLADSHRRSATIKTWGLKPTSSGVAAREGFRLPTPTALVIDVDREYGEVIGSVLRDYEVRVSTSAQDARVAQGPLDVAVIDRQAVDELGEFLTLVGALRLDHPDVVVVVTSREHLLVREIVACFAAGVDDYIPKPFHPREFAARVARFRARTGRAMSLPTLDPASVCTRPVPQRSRV